MCRAILCGNGVTSHPISGWQWNIDEYLKQQNIVAISGIDTRHLTKKLREYGVMNGAVTTEYETIDREKLLEDIRSFVIVDAVKSVSCKTIREEKSEQGLYRVV